MGSGDISNSGIDSINVTGKLVGNIIKGLDEKGIATLFEKLNSKQTADLKKCICDTAVLAAEKIGEKVEEGNEKLLTIIRDLIEKSLSVIKNTGDGSLGAVEFEDLKTQISSLLTQESFYAGLQLYSEKIIQAFELNLWKETLAAVEALHEEINADYPDSERIETECDNILKKGNATTDQREFAMFCKIVCGKGTTNSKRKNLLKQKPSLKCVSYVEDILLCAIAFAKRETIILTDGYLGMCENIYVDCGINFGKLHEQLNSLKEGLDNSVFILRDNDVFIMYSSQDCATVNEIYNGLESFGIKCFCAAINVRRNSGRNYLSIIEDAMKRCKALLFVSSKISRQSSDDIAEECKRWQQKTLDEYRGIDSSVTHYRDVDAQYNVRFHCVIDGAVNMLEAGLKETLCGIDHIYYSSEDIEKLAQLIRSSIMKRDNYRYQKKFHETLELGRELETQKMEEAAADVEKKSATTELTVDIQSENNNNPVMEDFEIEDGLLKRYCGEGVEVVIPDSVKSIGPFALGAIGTEIEKIVVPAGVAQIDYLAFGDCPLLSQIIVSAENKSFCDIDGVLFDKEKTRIIKYPNGREEKKYSIPDGVTAIGHRAFNSCRQLTKILIPDSVIVIEKAPDGTLGDVCPQEILGSVSINTLLTISADAFGGCGSLSNIIVSSGNSIFCDIDGVLFNKAKSQIIKYPCGRADERYTIPDGVTSIGEYAFSGCEGLESITIPDGVTSIGDSAFSGCEGLESITIPDSVTSIGDSAFARCRWLEIINFNGSESQWKAIEKDEWWDWRAEFNVTFSDKKPNKNGEVVKTEKQTPSVKASPLEDFEIKNGLLVKYNGKGGDVVIPEGVSIIDHGVFDGCVSLTSITIPSSVEFIRCSFYDCNSLTRITVAADNRSFCDVNGVLFYKDKHVINEIICYPAGKTEQSYEIPNSVTCIGDVAFGGCSSLTRVIIPNSVTEICNCAFRACSSLTSINIPNRVKRIHEYVFGGCSSLTRITVAADNSNYCDENGVLFNKDKSKIICYPAGKTEQSYKIPNSVTAIGDSAFEDCRSLTNLIIPDSVTEIWDNAFENCSSLTSIIIPESITEIGEEVFKGCENLKNISMPKGLEPDGIDLFGEEPNHIKFEFYEDKGTADKGVDDYPTLENYDKTEFRVEGTVLKKYLGKKQDVQIPRGITELDHNVFKWCHFLKSVFIPDSLKIIGAFAFSWCGLLSDVVLPDGVTEIHLNAFAHCRSLKSIFIPKSVKKMDSYVFSSCNEDLAIYCEAEQKPQGWNKSWNYDNYQVYWGSKREDAGR